MKVCGIVSEYNPFHSGHAYLIRRAKENADVVVAVMSGHFVQRGEVAVLDKYTRAKCALLGGVDLVLELPIPFCTSSASFFARAGVDVLSMVGTNMLAFGSESGDTERLLALAERLLADTDRDPDAKEGSAIAHFKELLDDEQERLSPNDILAVEYLAAIQKRGLDMSPLAVLRVGDGFLCETTGASAYASATSLRKCMWDGDAATMANYMPKACFDQLCTALENGEAPAALKTAERAILSFFR
ncbi:MAG: nucleotidyltransferase family protein, partial [Clostridia bacterium]|nr:nucleotidyltransferase family protein [Clostridia bacterium]